MLKKKIREIYRSKRQLLSFREIDELSFKSHKQIVKDELGEMANYLDESKIIITSRTADFDYSNESIAVYEMCPLKKKSDREFC